MSRNTGWPPAPLTHRTHLRCQNPNRRPWDSCSSVSDHRCEDTGGRDTKGQGVRRPFSEIQSDHEPDCFQELSTHETAWASQRREEPEEMSLVPEQFFSNCLNLLINVWVEPVFPHAPQPTHLSHRCVLYGLPAGSIRSVNSAGESIKALLIVDS